MFRFLYRFHILEGVQSGVQGQTISQSIPAHLVAKVFKDCYSHPDRSCFVAMIPFFFFREIG